MALRPLTLLLIAPLAALILTAVTPASAQDRRAARADRIEDRVDRRVDNGRLDRIEDRVDRRTGPGAYYRHPQRAHRKYYRKHRNHYRRHYRPLRKHRRYGHHRPNRRPHFYFRW